MVLASRITRTEAGSPSDLEAVEARVSYVLPAAGKLFAYEYDPPPGTPRRSAAYREYRVLIRNARHLAPRPSLDRQGFALRQQSTRVQDFYDAAEVEAVYYPELERLLKDATGARSILIFDHTVRGSAPAGGRGTAVREPVNRVHNDYTPASAPRRVRDLLPRSEAERLLRHRVVEINVWRPIRGPLETRPLAVCDATSMQPEDFVACDLFYRERVGEIYYVEYRARHEWYYFPRMRADEALLLKCFDSDPARARFGAHAAFEHPHTPPDALPRESIEARAFAFFAPS